MCGRKGTKIPPLSQLSAYVFSSHVAAVLTGWRTRQTVIDRNISVELEFYFRVISQLFSRTSCVFKCWYLINGKQRITTHRTSSSIIIIIKIIINEVQLTWRKVAKLQCHVTKKRVTWSVMGPKNARKVQTSADVGIAAAMWMPVRLLTGCSRRPVQQRQKHGRRLSNAACDGQPVPRSSQSEVAAVNRRRRREADRPTDILWKGACLCGSFCNGE